MSPVSLKISSDVPLTAAEPESMSWKSGNEHEMGMLHVMFCTNVECVIAYNAHVDVSLLLLTTNILSWRLGDASDKKQLVLTSNLT